MPFDRDALRQAADAANRRIRDRAPSGVAAMLAGLHQGSLAAFVTVESVALPPVPEVLDGRWTLLSLLAIPEGPGGPVAGLLPPWGWVRWNADGTVAATGRLPEPPATGPYAFAPDRAAWSRLLAALDTILASPPADPGIGHLYENVLPAAVVDTLHVLAPGTKNWL